MNDAKCTEPEVHKNTGSSFLFLFSSLKIRAYNRNVRSESETEEYWRLAFRFVRILYQYFLLAEESNVSKQLLDYKFRREVQNFANVLLKQNITRNTRRRRKKERQ